MNFSLYYVKITSKGCYNLFVKFIKFLQLKISQKLPNTPNQYLLRRIFENFIQTYS